MWSMWLIIAGFCFILEIVTVGFFIFWFGIGALLAMLTSFLFPDNIIMQVSVFVISSVLLLLLTKPLANKIAKKDKTITTNAYSIIGKKGIVTQDINPTIGIGQIKVSGEVWSAKTEDGTNLEKGSEISIIRIDGVKAVVEPLNSKSNIFFN